MQNDLIKSEQYVPDEDTFFLADYLKNETGKNALDIGTGSGYLAKILLEKFSKVIATDSKLKSLKQQKPKFPNLVCCN